VGCETRQLWGVRPGRAANVVLLKLQALERRQGSRVAFWVHKGYVCWDAT
jgi:hypothetical protein